LNVFKEEKWNSRFNIQKMAEYDQENDKFIDNRVRRIRNNIDMG